VEELEIMAEGAEGLSAKIRACRICEARFLATRTAHVPRPVPWLSETAPVLIAGQAPGARVHKSGKPFDDPSGDRLREWLGVDRAAFYDRGNFAILPMAFCFPGYDARGSDQPPPKICAREWRERALAVMPGVRLTLLVGAHAQRWHLGAKTGGVTATVRDWREFGAQVMPLPHPSWRNTGWLVKNPWFEAELLPVLRERVSGLLSLDANTRRQRRPEPRE
jgi:uracil-DNA glycosylase